MKTGPIRSADLGGLAEFTRRHPSFRPLVLCDATARATAVRAGFEAMHWAEFLLAGAPSGTDART